MEYQGVAAASDDAHLLEQRRVLDVLLHDFLFIEAEELAVAVQYQHLEEHLKFVAALEHLEVQDLSASGVLVL